MIDIRLLETHSEYLSVEDLQRNIWGITDGIDIVPGHLLITVQKNGGVVLGAFDPEGGKENLIGFVFGFAGITHEGSIKHCSHMAGVLPEYQNQNIGYRLKKAQREHILDKNIELITWTYDPLESRNAYLNIHKLGVTCRTYIRNLYGELRESLNEGMQTDRFQVDWHIAREHVINRLGETGGDFTLSELRSGDALVLEGEVKNDLLQPPERKCEIEGERILVQIPSDIQMIKRCDMSLALCWQEYVRMVFEYAFSEGYTATDMFFETGRSYYLLDRSWRIQ